MPTLVSGDYVFVAGQMPNNAAMTGLEPEAYRAPNAVWNGTDIRLQTEFLITSRLKPGPGGGRQLAQECDQGAGLPDEYSDLPEFMDVWNSHFADSPCALTVVATKGLALLESIIEINIFGVRDDGKVKKEPIEHAPSASMRLGPAAVRAGDLLCLSGLYAADQDGAIPAVAMAGGLHYLGVPAQRQMTAILTAADDICRAGGTSLRNVVRANHFVGDLAAVYPALEIWRTKLAGAPIPFGAVRTKLPIPACDMVMDMWAYAPG